jgi:hypothetical protein
MNTQSVFVGEVFLDQKRQIDLYAASEVPFSKSSVAVLKAKLEFLLNSRFRTALDPRNRFLQVDEIAKRWRSTPARVARMVRKGQLHPIIVINDKAFFDPAAVALVLGASPKSAENDL